MNRPDDEEPTVDELGENLAELLRQNREENDALDRIGERVDEIYNGLVTGQFPFLPPQRVRWRRHERGGDAR